ncbi:heavy-metal-associated domain-containing protein [Cupriavidus metallidurans]|uniref:heavy-metal-associated domain-containing protein n=1 Tax=Cupriavidus metallidurans TaxID=119219 RepID=UPI0035C6E30B
MRTIVAALLLAFGAIGLLAAGTGLPARAQSADATTVESQSETFAIENMTCALCPVTVRKAMEGVAGVKSVKIDFENKTATVLFDPAVTDRAAIAAASTRAGYPAAAAGG